MKYLFWKIRILIFKLFHRKQVRCKCNCLTCSYYDMCYHEFITGEDYDF